MNFRFTFFQKGDFETQSQFLKPLCTMCKKQKHITKFLLTFMNLADPPNNWNVWKGASINDILKMFIFFTPSPLSAEWDGRFGAEKLWHKFKSQPSGLTGFVTCKFSIFHCLPASSHCNRNPNNRLQLDKKRKGGKQVFSYWPYLHMYDELAVDVRKSRERDYWLGWPQAELEKLVTAAII